MSTTGSASPRPKYVPSPEGLNAEFYLQAQSGTLHLQRCAGCGRFRHPPRYYCPACGSDRFEWQPSPGRGRLYSWTVTHRALDPGWVEEIPYLTGVVELDEGVRLVAALEGVEPAEAGLGLPVVAHLEPRTEDFVFIRFRPVGEDR